MHKKSVQSRHFVVCAKERNNVLYGQETLCFLCKRKKHFSLHKKCFVVSVKETLFSVHCKHFVVYVNVRNTVLCPQEKLCCQCKRKKHSCLCTGNTLFAKMLSLRVASQK